MGAGVAHNVREWLGINQYCSSDLSLLYKNASCRAGRGDYVMKERNKHVLPFGDHERHGHLISRLDKTRMCDPQCSGQDTRWDGLDSRRVRAA